MKLCRDGMLTGPGSERSQKPCCALARREGESEYGYMGRQGRSILAKGPSNGGCRCIRPRQTIGRTSQRGAKEKADSIAGLTSKC
jgi:hypothetical protein